MNALALKDKTALVTGASQGIGEAVARRLAAEGARLVLAARSQDKLEAIAEDLRSAGCEAVAHTLDLAQPGEVAARLEALPEGFGDIDILVNNAGITSDGLFVRMDLDQWQRVLDTNLTGAYAVTRALARGMMRRRWGRIVNVSSVVGLMGNAGQANYSAAKAGLIGFSKALARELAARNITVNVVAPGYIQTAMTEDLPEAAKAELEAAIPLKRLGEVQDIAAGVAFLAGEEAGYITGHVLNISGGLYI